MDEVLLTPAGIADALGKLLPLDQDMLYNCHKVSQAQHAKTKRELVEWLAERGGPRHDRGRRLVDLCFTVEDWQQVEALRREVA